jgi:hypothetical protein
LSAPVRPDLRPWVPPGWGLIASARGDLDGDGRADAVLVLQKQDAGRVRPVDGPGGPQVDLNERRLQVLLARPGGGYRRVFSSDQTIPPEGNEDNPCVVDRSSTGTCASARACWCCASSTGPPAAAGAGRPASGSSASTPPGPACA